MNALIQTLLLVVIAAIIEQSNARLEGNAAEAGHHRLLPGNKPPEVCGNNKCRDDETCASCAEDCCPATTTAPPGTTTTTVITPTTTTTPTTATATCGNHIIEGAEQCDYDANNIDGVPAINGSCEPDPNGTCTTGDDFVRFLGCNSLDCTCPSLPDQGSNVDLQITDLAWAGSGGNTCNNGARDGDVCVVDYTVKNFGIDWVWGRTDCRSWRTCFYLMSSSNNDVCGGVNSLQLGCSVQNGLAPVGGVYPSDQHRGNPAFTIPVVDSGRYFLCAVADDGMDVLEMNHEDNNSRTVLGSIFIR